MTEKFALKFNKKGYMRYISHLDLLRLFKRLFRTCGIEIRYSQGFNQHPRLSFAQPLSLGYEGRGEWLEFETNGEYEPQKMSEILQSRAPEVIEITTCRRLPDNSPSLAALAESARYEIAIPSALSQEAIEKLVDSYMAQEDIPVEKKRKKDKKTVTVNIRPHIRELSGKAADGQVRLDALLDCGSAANCSPEHVISSFLTFAGLDVRRHEIEVVREGINFSNNLQNTIDSTAPIT